MTYTKEEQEVEEFKEFNNLFIELKYEMETELPSKSKIKKIIQKMAEILK